MRPQIYRYSTHKHGCRVVQTSFEVLRIEQKVDLLNQLLYQGLVIPCCFDYHGNHVIQKVFIEMGMMDPKDSEGVGINQIKHLISLIDSEIVNFCLHEYCCRIVQRMFEFCHPELLENTSRIIVQNFELLGRNEYGIFVLSSILDNGQHRTKVAVLSFVQTYGP